GGGGSKQ
ncbi:3-oxoacyl-[acyl-carrier-protein] reductase FabG, partial [Haemophilus influenzae]